MKLQAPALAVFMAFAAAAPSSSNAHPPQEGAISQARSILHQALSGGPSFQQIQAAEALIDCGEAESVRAIFEKENFEAVEPGVRIGALRVMAQCATAQRKTCIARLEAMLAQKGYPAVNIVESLCKLGVATHGETLARIRTMANEAPEADVVFALWALWLAGEGTARHSLLSALHSEIPTVKARAAYAFCYLPPDDPKLALALAQLADSDQSPEASHASISILAAALRHGGTRTQRSQWKARLLAAIRTGDTAAKARACRGMRGHFFVEDLPVLVPILNHPDASTRISAASAFLSISNLQRF